VVEDPLELGGRRSALSSGEIGLSANVSPIHARCIADKKSIADRNFRRRTQFGIVPIQCDLPTNGGRPHGRVGSGGGQNANLLQAWRAELEPLDPVARPVEAAVAPKPEGVTRSSAEVILVPEQVGAVEVSREALNVFASYSHCDEKMRIKLGQYSATLVNDGLIRIWHARQIQVGADWEGEINNEIAAADIILLLVSASFLDSRYCRSELQRALKLRGSGKTFQFRLSCGIAIGGACSIPSSTRSRRCLGMTEPVAGGWWPNQDAAYSVIVKELRTEVEKMRG